MSITYAVFVEDSYTIPGDERSRTSPGHGYPEQTVSYTRVIEFNDADGLREWIGKNRGEKFRAVRCSRIFVSTDIQIHLDGV